MLEAARKELLAARGTDLAEAAAEALIERIARKLDALLSKEQVAKLAEQLVAEVSTWNARQVRRQLAKELTGIVVPELAESTIERLTRHAISTIRGIPQEIAQRAAPLVRDGVLRGLRPEAFREELGERLGVSQEKARDVATGLVLRTNSKLTEERHQKLGITEYIWRASRDKFTRRWHRALDGTRQKYAEPPRGGGGGPHDHGNPASADKCRCQAIPVIPSP